MADNHDLHDEEEEEEEPKLKYERVGRGVEELLQRDTVSCLVAHEKFIVRHSSALYCLYVCLYTHFCIQSDCNTANMNEWRWSSLWNFLHAIFAYVAINLQY